MKLKIKEIDVFYPENSPTDLERDLLQTIFTIFESPVLFLFWFPYFIKLHSSKGE